MPDAVPAAGPRRPRPGAVRAVLGVHRRAAVPRDRRRQPVVRGDGLAVPAHARRRARAAQAVAERARRTQGQDHRRAPPAGRWPSPTTRRGADAHRRPRRGDGPVSAEIADAVVAVLAPLEAFVGAPGRRRADAVAATTAARSARSPSISPPSASSRSSTPWRSPAHRRRATSPRLPEHRRCWRRCGSATASRLPAGPVLLVDDTYRTGWTATVAGALLTEHGATSVLPLVIHQLP